MGPPKKRPKKIPYSELQRRWNYFEYHWDNNANSFYLYNPYTGETILSSNVALIDRSKSMWAPIEKYPSDKVQTIQLLPEWYCSKRWGRRRFSGWSSKVDAANHIVTVARGFLARLHMRQYYRHRYCKTLDTYSGYYYFVDRLNPDETVWYKPRLAFPDDILIPEIEDPDDYLKGYRFSKSNYEVGPLLKVTGLSKYDTGRTELTAFLIPNPVREIAYHNYANVNLADIQLHEVVAWMDDIKVSSVKFNEFHFMRTAIVNNDWARTLGYMKQYPQNNLIQLFGYYGLSKLFVPMSGDLIDFEAKEAMEMCVELIKDEKDKIDTKLKIYAMKALHNIFSVRSARVEYLNTEQVHVRGPERDAAVEEFLTKRLSIFNKYLTNIPTEKVKVFVRNEKEPREEHHPMFSALDIVGASLQCLCLLAEESESKEVMAIVILDPLIFALQVCHEDAFITLYAVKFMYNLCYRCEPGQQAIYLCCNPKNLLASISYEHSGDPEVMRQVRRLELALEPDGWRGNVEKQITKEFYGEGINEEESYTSDFFGSEGKGWHGDAVPDVKEVRSVSSESKSRK